MLLRVHNTGEVSWILLLAGVDGSPLEPPVARALEELAFFTNWVKIIGTYPRARDRAD
jgi:prephenate dehydratase